MKKLLTGEPCTFVVPTLHQRELLGQPWLLGTGLQHPGYATAMVFCFLITRKSEETMEGMKSLSWSPGIMGRVAHHPDASCWARGSQNATACQWAQQRALGLLRPSLMMQEYIVILPLAFRSFHQGMWVIFIISAWIHLCGWLTGSGPSGLDQDKAADGWAGTLGLAPLVGV